MIIAAAMGDPNASIPTPQPVHYRPMFAAFGGARAETCVTFVSGRALAEGIKERLGSRKRLVAVRGTRTIGKADLRLNDYLPRIDVDAQTYQVRADGQLLTCDPAEVLPLAKRISCFDGGTPQDQQMAGHAGRGLRALASSFQKKAKESLAAEA